MAKKREPSKAELTAYYDDHGWKETISKYRIAPADLSVRLGKSKAKKKPKKPVKKPAAKRGPGRPRKVDGPKKRGPGRPKKKIPNVTPATKRKKKKGKGGRKPNPILIIDKMQAELVRLRGIIQAAA